MVGVTASRWLRNTTRESAPPLRPHNGLLGESRADEFALRANGEARRALSDPAGSGRPDRKVNGNYGRVDLR